MVAERTYFTVSPRPNAGLVDTLRQITMARKLGLSLGYVYLYTAPDNLRSTGFMRPLTLPWVAAKLVDRMYHRFVEYRPSIYDQIGLSRHFSREAEAEGHPHPEEYRKVNIKLSDHILKKKGITTLDGLHRFIKDAVSQERISDYPLRIHLRVSYPSRLCTQMTNSIPASVDDLNLSMVYWKQRRESPRKSVFSFREGVKTLMHVRLGDTAAVKTPWGTWIYWRRSGKWVPFSPNARVCFEECRSKSEFVQLTVPDFHRFIRGLSACFDDNAFALSIFSDGYERFFKRFYIYNNAPSAGLGLLRKQVKAVLKRRRDCARELKMLKKTKNSVSIIGETSGKLIKLVDTAATADLLIVAFPSQMMAFNLSNLLSPSAEKLPVVLLLYKPVAEKRLSDFLEDHPSRRIIPVDVSVPDFAAAAARLVEFLPQLAPFLRSQSACS